MPELLHWTSHCVGCTDSPESVADGVKEEGEIGSFHDENPTGAFWRSSVTLPNNC